MGKKQTVDALVDGGKASAGPPLGSTLGPMKVNIAQVVAAINEKTKDFKGMKVPVKVIVDTETKEFTITIGTPPTTQLILKEIGVEKGSGEPHINKAGVIAFESVIKIANMKSSSLIINNKKAGVKTVLGSCQSAGILVDGKDVIQVMKEVDAGEYDNLIASNKTEVTAEKIAQLKAMGQDLELKKKQVEKQKAEAKAAAEALAAAKAATAPAAGATAGTTAAVGGAAPAAVKPAPAAKK
jgi:large subunit ribosomal protein L11